jgi:hypothetical protein
MRSSWSSERRPAYGASEIDRGCPLGTGIDPSMWHADGTTGVVGGQTKAFGGAGWRECCVKLDAGLWTQRRRPPPDDPPKPYLCGRAAGPEPPTTAPTGTIGARVLHGLHVTAARDKPLRILAAERFPIRQPPVDHRQVIWGSAPWAQPSRQAGGLDLRGWTAEPPAQRSPCRSPRAWRLGQPGAAVEQAHDGHDTPCGRVRIPLKGPGRQRRRRPAGRDRLGPGELAQPIVAAHPANPESPTPP